MRFSILSRSTQIKGINGKPLDKLGVQAATVEPIVGFYMLFERVRRNFDIRPENIWNMDECRL